MYLPTPVLFPQYSPFINGQSKLCQTKLLWRKADAGM